MKKNKQTGVIEEVPALGLIFADVLAVSVLIGLLFLAYSFFFKASHVELLHTRAHQNILLNGFEGAFAAEIDGGSVENVMHKNQVHWGFHSNLLYANGSEILSERGKRILGRCSKVLERIPDSLYQQIQVISYTKGGQLPAESVLRRGGMKDYFDLAAHRAKNVTNYLVRYTDGVAATLFNSSMQRVNPNVLEDRRLEVVIYLD